MKINAAVIQMNSGSDRDNNLKSAGRLVAEAVGSLGGKAWRSSCRPGPSMSKNESGL